MDAVHSPKKNAVWPNGHTASRKQLALDRTHGALIGTSAAIDASVSVDNVLAVALGDRTHGAALGASAAHNASITNNKSHVFTPPFR